MSQYDCFNLRANADFEVPICRNVFWVPVNALGKTRYSNQEMHDLIPLSPDEKREKIHTLYEAVQLFLLSKFHEELDTIYIEENEYIWEHHKPGYYAILSNRGCCASDASWLHYLLKDKYETTGYFAFLRPNGSGHVYNYIFHDNWFYLYDLCPLTDRYVDSALIETGKREDYLKTKYISGALIKCKSLEDYAHYFKRIQLRGGFDHLFLKYEMDIVPPIASKKNGIDVTFYYPDEGAISLLLDQETPTIKFKRIAAPKALPDWSIVNEALI